MRTPSSRVFKWAPILDGVRYQNPFLTSLWIGSGLGWPFKGFGPKLRQFKWGLISKVWTRAFSWQSWNPLSIFLPFQNLLPHCVMLCFHKKVCLQKVKVKLRMPSQNEESQSQCGSNFWNGKKMLKGFQECHENALIQSFEMSPHLMVWRSYSQTL